MRRKVPQEAGKLRLFASCLRAAKTYPNEMNQAPITYPAFVKLVAAGLGLAILGGLGLAMWMERGATMFHALVEAGLSWCL